MLSVVSGEAICLALRGAISRSYQPLRGVAVVPLDEPHAEFEVQVAWRRGETSALVCEFLQVCSRVVRAGRRSWTSSRLS